LWLTNAVKLALLKVIDELLKEICTALISADVNAKLVLELRSNLKKTLALEEMSAGLNRRNVIRQVRSSLCSIRCPPSTEKDFLRCFY
jgi:signal recognition particle GTPase